MSVGPREDLPTPTCLQASSASRPAPFWAESPGGHAARRSHEVSPASCPRGSSLLSMPGLAQIRRDRALALGTRVRVPALSPAVGT